MDPLPAALARKPRELKQWERQREARAATGLDADLARLELLDAEGVPVAVYEVDLDPAD